MKSTINTVELPIYFIAGHRSLNSMHNSLLCAALFDSNKAQCQPPGAVVSSRSLRVRNSGEPTKEITSSAANQLLKRVVEYRCRYLQNDKQAARHFDSVWRLGAVDVLRGSALFTPPPLPRPAAADDVADVQHSFSCSDIATYSC